MRGATEGQETLGAQQLKSQYGSVRVREKSAELQRVAADAVKIAAEIIAENFSKETVLDMSQMDVPTKADITRRIKEIEKAAKEELEGLKASAQEAMQNPQAQEAIGRAHVCNPVTNAQIVCRHLHEQNNNRNTHR